MKQLFRHVTLDECGVLKWLVALLWEPRDLWVGVFWKRIGDYRQVFICLLPTFPLVVQWWKQP